MTTLTLWPVLTGGRCSDVAYRIKIEIGPLKWWPLQAGGRYSQVAVSSGLTVVIFWLKKYYIFDHQLHSFEKLTEIDCFENCSSQHSNCEWFTFEPMTKRCLIYKNCQNVSTSKCPNCISGNSTCQRDCYFKGACQGRLIAKKVSQNLNQNSLVIGNPFFNFIIAIET